MRLKTQGLVVPSPLAISAGVQPCEAEVATSLTIAAALGVSLVQSISPIVEGHEAGELPFVGVGFNVHFVLPPADFRRQSTTLRLRIVPA
jgi:hypothetical protein